MATAHEKPLDIPIPEIVDLGAPIDTLNRIHDVVEDPGKALRVARAAALDLRREFATSGVVNRASTHDLVTLPYPTEFGLWRAPLSPAPFLFISNRLVVVQWVDSDGTPRTLLWEPSDIELDANTPYFLAVRNYCQALRGAWL